MLVSMRGEEYHHSECDYQQHRQKQKALNNCEENEHNNVISGDEKALWQEMKQLSKVLQIQSIRTSRKLLFLLSNSITLSDHQT